MAEKNYAVTLTYILSPNKNRIYDRADNALLLQELHCSVGSYLTPSKTTCKHGNVWFEYSLII
jgi:hypothetical protein